MIAQACFDNLQVMLASVNPATDMRPPIGIPMKQLLDKLLARR